MWYSRLFVLLLVVYSTVGMVQGVQGAGVVFRFLPGSPELSSAFISSDIETGPFLDPRELVARGPAGWGLQAPFSAEFLGSSSTLQSDGLLPMNQPLGPRLTAELWFRPSLIDGRIALLNNRTEGSDGFSLELIEGAPYFELTIEGRTFSVQAQTLIEPNEMHWVAATVRYTGNGTLFLSLHLNGEEVASFSETTTISSPYVIGAPFFLGTRAEANDPSPSLTGEYVGHIFSATVRDYITDEKYLSSTVPFDGSTYFGLPAFHDYPLDGFHLPMDQRMDNEPTEVRRRFFLPYVNDAYIPQGTASYFSENEELVYVAYHHRKQDGTLREQRSIIAEMDAATGRVRRTFRLRGQLEYSHAGGIAFSHDALFVSSVNFLERYPVPAYEGPDSPKYIDLFADPTGSINIESKASFVSAFEDTLWVGDWRPSADVAPFLYAHALNADGRPEATASRIFALPRNVQGVDLFKRNGQTYVFLSRNRNSREAEVHRYRIGQLDRNEVASPDTIITLPHGIEDLSFQPNGDLWTNSESGTVYYQRRDSNPWLTFYPFVYSVPAHVVLPEELSTAVERQPVTPDIHLQTYPNPVRSFIHIAFESQMQEFVSLYIVDALGRRLKVLEEAVLGPGSHSYRWDVHSQAPGIYFTVLESERKRQIKPFVVIR